MFSPDRIVETLKDAGIYKAPYVPSSTWKPLVDFKFKLGDIEVNHGNKLLASQTKALPKVEFDADPSAKYAIIQVDLDAPSYYLPFLADILHWVQFDIAPALNYGVSLRSDIVSELLPTEKPYVPYAGCGAPRLTGFHRYVFLLYKQTQDIKSVSDQGFPETISISTRKRFNLEGFIKENGLELVGINFYYGKNG